MDILRATFEHVRRIRDIRKIHIKTILCRSPFTVVELSDGSVGSAANYTRQYRMVEEQVCIKAECVFSRLVRHDPLLEDTLKNRKDLLSLSLKTAILSALSQPLFSTKVLQKYEITMKKIRYTVPDAVPFFEGYDSAAIIGWGGVLESALSSSLKTIYVSDLLFDEKYVSIHIKPILNELYKRTHFKGKVILLNGRFNKKIMMGSDVAAITGSALCNGTMEELLNYARGCKRIMVQGPSASIFPSVLGAMGVTDVLSTKKSRDELKVGIHPDERILRIVDKHYFYLAIPRRSREN